MRAWLRTHGISGALVAIAILGVLFGVAGFFLGANSASLMTYNPDPDGNRGDAVRPAKTGHEVRGAILSKENLDARLRGHDGNSVVSSSSSATPLSPPVANRFVAPDFRSDPDDKGDAIIAGHVYDCFGKPVAGVEVTCVRSDFWLPRPDMPYLEPCSGADASGFYRSSRAYLAALARQTRVTFTDASGAFKLTGLSTATPYDLKATTKNSGDITERNVASGDVSVELYLSNISVPVRGRVVSTKGESISTFLIHATLDERDRNYSEWVEVIDSADGSFEMGLPKGGLWEFTVRASGLYSRYGHATTQISETEANHVEFEIVKGVVLSGRVIADGEPVPNVRIQLLSNDRPIDDDITGSDSLGHYRFCGLQPGTYTVVAYTSDWSEGRVKVTIGAEDIEQDIEVILGATLVLKLVDQSGSGLMEDYTSMYRRDSERSVAVVTIQRSLGETRYAGFEPGRYQLYVHVRGRATKAIETEIRDGENILSLVFPEPCSLQGKVALSNDGVEISQFDLRIEASSVSPHNSEEEDWQSCSVSGNGEYNLNGPLESGQAKIKIIQDHGTELALFETTLTLSPGINTYDIAIPPVCVLMVTDKTPLEVGLPDKDGLYIIDYPRFEITLFPKVIDLANPVLVGYEESDYGTIAFIGIRPGTYTLTAQLGSGKKDYFAEPFDVTVGEGTTNVTVQFHKANCVRVEYVYPHSQAAEAGIREDDKIFSYNGEAVNNEKQFKDLMDKTTDANSVTIMIDRKGTTFPLTLKGGSLGVNVTNALR